MILPTSSSPSAALPREAAVCHAFHPLENQDSVTLLSFQVPPWKKENQGEKQQPVKKTKQAYFDICLDVSGSMAGSGIECAKVAMKRLIDHLIQNCEVPPERITVYLYESSCQTRRLKDGDTKWINSVKAGGGTSFASVFNEVIKNIKLHRAETNMQEDMDVTLFFFTDGEDGDGRNLDQAKQKLEDLLKSTLRLESTVHTFGFTAGHDAKLLSWLTSTGKYSGCFQYIQQSSAIETSMSTTLMLLDDSAMVMERKIEISWTDTDKDHAQEWLAVKLERAGVAGSTVIRGKPFSRSMIQWREYESGEDSNPIQDLQVLWLPEDSPQRITGTTQFIQHELLRLIEEINSIGSNGQLSAEQKRTELLKIDAETEACSKILGTMAFAAAKLKQKEVRGSCMVACQRTRSLLQSFLTVKADAHKRGGSISNTSLATFNALAYGEITEAKLKAKLDARAGKNTALFADLDQKVDEVVKGLDLDKMEAEESEERLRVLSCAFSTNSYIDALRDGDCLCMTLDVSRGAGAIADPSQVVIKSIFPTYLTSSMFTLALGHSLAQNDPEDVHGGFDRNSDASIAPGLAHENITAVMPLFINKEHWQVAKLRMKPILGYVVTLDATGYTYSQSTTIPFLILAKALEAYPMTEFRQRQVQLILETCDAIYRSSKTLCESTRTLVEQFCASHTQRTVDVITNNYVFLGHVICALRAGDITAAEMSALLSTFETAIVEEQIRRDMSWRVSSDLFGNILDWFNVDRQKDVAVPGRKYREQHDAYVAALERDNSDNGIVAHYQSLFNNTRKDQGVKSKSPKTESTSPHASTSAPSSASVPPTIGMASLSVKEVAPISKPEFKVPDFDPLRWELSEASLDRLSSIQHAISAGVDKIRRLLAIIHSPLDTDLPEVLSLRLGAMAPTAMADEFFARYSPKTNLATLLQAYAHTKNADRRSVENLMTPFEREVASGPDTASDEAIQFLKSLYMAKMTDIVGGVVAAVENEYMEAKRGTAASVFLSTNSLEVAAAVLIDSKFRGAAGGQLTTLCARSTMTLPRAKIQMLLTGSYKGVKLFTDKSGSLEDIRWYPCKKTLYRMFRHYHDQFSLDEWRQFHPNRYESYIARRYVLDHCLDELPQEQQVEVNSIS
ncbi:hypothetical protein BC939DRAFT_480755 [Gamsiella multidivaricata]|uniref:uncharacterized protein n=1 Tax=Gamsiella multidivaricata TaxID=101098 RepID=UPI00221F612C|nr:uncharacterized protein BC939DRAFT_480755 [Gamsiella multidivaricata]KAG0366650.1 hypothetical protein BGZ54_005073 [Gamsiella multidivaricata]KAI7817997.1 hypothetical protein BC939DRAFT_480755 [Gamsiella multidivaricata]